MFGVSDGLRPFFAFDGRQRELAGSHIPQPSAPDGLSPELYRTLLDLSQELICYRQLDDTIVFANEAYGQFFGKRPADLIGTRWLPPIATPDISVLERFATSTSTSAPVRCIREIVVGHKPIERISVLYQGVFDQHNQLIGLYSSGTCLSPVECPKQLTSSPPEMQQRLLNKKDETIRQLAISVAEAQEQERRRIAVDIHDEIGQNLYLLRLRLDNLPHTPRPENSRHLHELLTIIDATIQKTRSMTSAISSQILRDFGLAKAVRSIADELGEHFSLTVSITVDELPDDTPRIMTTVIYRGIRELLYNAAKHAKARHAEVRVRCADMFVYVSVEDDGERQALVIDESDFGFGLKTLKEQLELLGGMFSINREERSNGLKAEFVLPLQTSQHP